MASCDDLRSEGRETTAIQDVFEDFDKQGDEELLSRAIAGDDRAFDAIVLRHGNTIYRYASRQLWTLELAEEVVSDVFTGLFKAILSSRDGSNTAPHRLLPWLIGVASKRVADTRRRERRESAKSAPLDQINEERLSTSDAAEEVEHDQWIASMLDVLPERARDVVCLNLDGFRVKEIAEMLGLTSAATYQILSRAMRVLRDRKDELGE